MSTILLHFWTGREVVKESDGGVLQADPEPDPAGHNPEGGKDPVFRRDPRRVQGGSRQVWQTLYPGFGFGQVLLHAGGDWQELAGVDAFLLPRCDHGLPGEDLEPPAARAGLLPTAAQNFPRICLCFLPLQVLINSHHI